KGDEIETVVLAVDAERERISLGMKQCRANPWEEFAATHNKNDRVAGIIKSITDFGIFIGLDGGIDGLVHLSDLSWDIPGEEAVRNFKKGDEIETVVLAVDAERERISLGVKQLAQDPFSSFLADSGKGAIVNGKIISVDAKSATVDLGDGIEGVIRASEISRDQVDDARKVLKENETVEAMIIGVDRKRRVINLSIKAKEHEDETVALQEYSADNDSGTAKLGDLLKEHLDAK
ncbi:MAG: S1 RNA-binding domain-containing protein, partial [Gammaproteobacteria bacterium]